jgi:hypothetical protein
MAAEGSEKVLYFSCKVSLIIGIRKFRIIKILCVNLRGNNFSGNQNVAGSIPDDIIVILQ